MCCTDFCHTTFLEAKTMWFLANSSIWSRKMLLNLTILHPTTSLNVFLSQFPSFSSYLEQRTVWNTIGPFLVMFSFMKYQIFVPKTPNIFAIIPGPPSTIVDWSRLSWYQSCQIFSKTHKTEPYPIYISFLQLFFFQNSWGILI